MTAVVQDGKRDKRVYRLTAAGRRALEEWLGMASAPTRLRDDSSRRSCSPTTSAWPSLGS